MAFHNCFEAAKEDFPGIARLFAEVLIQIAPEQSCYSSKEKMRLHILAEITRLRRACCHSTLVHPEMSIASSKLSDEELLQLLEL